MLIRGVTGQAQSCRIHRQEHNMMAQALMSELTTALHLIIVNIGDL